MIFMYNHQQLLPWIIYETYNNSKKYMTNNENNTITFEPLIFVFSSYSSAFLQPRKIAPFSKYMFDC